MDEDDRYQNVLGELKKLYTAWLEYQTRVAMEIGEYKKTVNTAISLLSQEALQFQHDTRRRLDADAALRAERQRHADRKDIAVLAGVGCLIILNALAVAALGITVIYLTTRTWP